MDKTKEKITVKSLAQEMSDNLITKKRENGDKFICQRNIIEWQIDIIYKAHNDKSPDDYVYQFIDDILSTFLQYDTIEEMQDAIYEIEPDCYTSNLTAWLNSRCDRVYYLTEALGQEYGTKEGFQLLAIAQQQEIQEIANILLEELQKEVENRE